MRSQILRTSSVNKVVALLGPFEGGQTETMLRYFIAFFGTGFPEQIADWLQMDAAQECDEVSRRELFGAATRALKARSEKRVGK